jgi:predicted O-methyltransferase YrrM/precorrin-2 methylase
MTRNDSEFDVALMGWGTRGVHQVTVEQLRALAQARDIVVDPGAPPSIHQMLAAYEAPVHDLSTLYRDGAQKEDVYPAMTAAVLALAESRGATVWMTYGHPLVYSMPSRLLLGECRARGLRLKVLSGISSVAEVMSVLGLDIAERDLQVTFANHVVTRRRPIDPAVDLVVMQPGALAETGLCRDPEQRRKRDVSAYRALQEHLLRFYPADHVYTSICLSDEEGVPHQVVEAQLARIEELAPDMHYGQTWYIRAVPQEGRPIAAEGAVREAPAALEHIAREAVAAGTHYGSDAHTGALLRTLAASKPGGHLLELGTGIGLGTAWLLDGMDADARLTSVDIQDVGGIARRCLGDDARLELLTMDGALFLAGIGARRFDLIFADAPPGKLAQLEQALDALAPGGLYVADDMDPGLHTSERSPHIARVAAELRARADFQTTFVPGGSGVVVATRRG